MNQKIYVGNLPYEATDGDLQSLFGEFGGITEVKLIMDHGTGRSKGFGFITFENADAANDAQKLNGSEFNGRQIRVSLAKDNGGQRGGGGRRQGGGFNRGGNGGGRGGNGYGNGGGNGGGYGNGGGRGGNGGGYGGGNRDF